MKYYGKIGYGVIAETQPHSGVWEDTIIERAHKGELTRNSRRIQNGEDVNDNITISNEITIIADPYALQNYMNIRYAEVRGARWKVNYVEVLHPRLKLTLGGVYNGPIPPPVPVDSGTNS
ncbi:MAG: hypothetical protein J6U54_03130 [Clostridiales bacterium]|nr:hypothetical protein [Clostridiales bacterium]